MKAYIQWNGGKSRKQKWWQGNHRKWKKKIYDVNFSIYVYKKIEKSRWYIYLRKLCSHVHHIDSSWPYLNTVFQKKEIWKFKSDVTLFKQTRCLCHTYIYIILFSLLNDQKQHRYLFIEIFVKKFDSEFFFLNIIV